MFVFNNYLVVSIAQTTRKGNDFFNILIINLPKKWTQRCDSATIPDI